MNVEDTSLAALEGRLRTILPPLYQDSYEQVQPISMGSASLKYDEHGKVAWDQMWDSFCDLAMAGGPPHKGALLAPATQAELEAEPAAYGAVVEEICRGIALVSDLEAKPATDPGWIRVRCDDALMAEWLVRAIVMENVSAHWDDTAIFLPAGPAYRLDKGIKNVVTVVAKTCHYWVDHMWLSQQREIAALFAAMAQESPLVQCSFPVGVAADAPQYEHLRSAIQKQTGLQTVGQTHGWLGIECPSVKTAISLMRSMVVSNVLARREGTSLFLPIPNQSDGTEDRVLQTLAGVYSLLHKDVS